MNNPRALDEDMEKSRARSSTTCPDDDWEAYKKSRVDEIRRGMLAPREMRLRNGRIIQYRCIALPDGGRMLTYFDITELKRIEDACAGISQPWKRHGRHGDPDGDL